MDWEDFYKLTVKNIPRSNPNRKVFFWAIKKFEVKNVKDLLAALSLVESVLKKTLPPQECEFGKCGFSKEQIAQAIKFLEEYKEIFQELN